MLLETGGGKVQSVSWLCNGLVFNGSSLVVEFRAGFGWRGGALDRLGGRIACSLAGSQVLGIVESCVCAVSRCLWE